MWKIWKRAGLIAFIAMFIPVLSACSMTDDSKNKNISVDISYDKASIKSDVQTLLNTGSTDGCSSFSDDFVFDSGDTVSYDGGYQEYYFGGAYYIQVGGCMYRFQMDASGKIYSYIKYGLKA